MGRTFASWLTGPPGRAVLATGLFGLLPLLGLGFAFFLPGAVPALVALRRSARDGLLVALSASALLAAAMWFAGRPLPVGLTYAAWLLGPPLLLAALLGRTQSLSLCLQVTVLVGALLLVLLHLSLGDPAAFWAPFVRDLATEMQRRGLPLEIDTDVLVDVLARTLWGWIAVLTMLLGVLGLFLARWWQAQLVAERGSFGVEFRALRLGRVLGVAAALLVVAALLTKQPLVDDLARLFVGALVLVGLAAVHRAKANERLAGAWLWVVYLLLITPLSPFVVLLLAGWGFADNWQRSGPAAAPPPGAT
jgi:hypothetical protein